MLYTVEEMAKKPGRVTYTRSATRKKNTKNIKTGLKINKIKIIFTLRLGLATVWAQGNYSLKLFCFALANALIIHFI